MRLGIIAPQGWVGEYDGWEPQRAWARTVAVAQQAEAIGAESVWLFDHFHTVPRPTDYAELGVSRVIGLVRASADSDEALEELATDARAAGVELARTIGPFGGVDAPG
jgi:hypothetical protein